MISYILIGLPASGKSTWVREKLEKCNMDNIVVTNNDSIRECLYQALGSWKWSSRIEESVKEQREKEIKDAYALGYNVIVDNTHMNPRTLQQITDFCKKLGYEIELVDFRHVPVDECVRRDSLRTGSAKVGEEVIRKMAKLMKSKDARLLPEWNAASKNNCIIVDIDGTLANMGDRNPFDEGSVYNDAVRQHVLYTVRSLVECYGFKLMIFSGRTDACEKETRRWLHDKCCLSNDQYELHMRKHGDERRDSFIKLDLYNEFVKERYNVFAVFDDRPQVVRELWKVLNLPVFNCGVIDVEF